MNPDGAQTRAFPHRHLLSIQDLDAADIVQLLDLGDVFLEINQRPIKKVPTLRGRTIINLFLENSTRTRMSFELAGKRLSADSVNISGSGSSASKGETTIDTVRNLQAMYPDVIVVRHYSSGAAALIARSVDAAVVNAGDGKHEHPSQALLDCSTIREHKGDFRGLEVAIVGDIEHSRVARSNILALSKLGANVRLCGPATLIPHSVESIGGDVTREHVTVHHRLEPAIEGADVVMMLRIQNERLGTGGPRFANTREYSRFWGLNRERLRLTKDDAIVMHPGPINRGVEMSPDVADGERSVILEQVTRGVAVRMAILYLLGAANPAVE
jgi:aspartate carbamoyltransferase catalytic subunit